MMLSSKPYMCWPGTVATTDGRSKRSRSIMGGMDLPPATSMPQVFSLIEGLPVEPEVKTLTAGWSAGAASSAGRA